VKHFHSSEHLSRFGECSIAEKFVVCLVMFGGEDVDIISIPAFTRTSQIVMSRQFVPSGETLGTPTHALPPSGGKPLSTSLMMLSTVFCGGTLSAGSSGHIPNSSNSFLSSSEIFSGGIARGGVRRRLTGMTGLV
jgi:hypothetical protein